MSTPGRIAKFDPAGRLIDSSVTETAQQTIGIGTAAPSVKTQIEGNTDLQATIAIRRSDNNKFVRLGVGGQGVALDFDPTSFFVMMKNTGGIGSLLIGQELLRVTPDGHVGIGTPTPVTPLHVGGNLTLDSGNSPVLFTGTANIEHNRYLLLINSPDLLSASGLKAGGILVADQYDFANPGKNDLIVKGKVGIGTTQPATALQVQGTVRAADLELSAAPGGHEIAFIGENVAGGGVLQLLGPNGTETVRISGIIGAPNSGFIGVTDAPGAHTARMAFDTNGHSIVEADVKHFRVPHPTQAGTDIVYACIEGSEAAVYLRGTGTLVKGQASIPLPDHFTIVANPEGMTVQVTPLSADSPGLAVVAKGPTGIVVKELHGGAGNYDFDWEVKCVRKGHEDYRVTRPRDAVSERPVGRQGGVLPTELPPRT